MSYPKYFVDLDPDNYVQTLRVTMTEEETNELLVNIPGLIEVQESQAELLTNMTGRRWRLEGSVFVEHLDRHNKETKWGMLKLDRDAAENAGFTWDGSTFDSDKTSQSRIQGASQLAILAVSSGSPFSIDWTLADNTVRTLSAQDMIAVGVAMGQHIQAQHAKGRQLRANLDAATTPQEIDSIQW